MIIRINDDFAKVAFEHTDAMDWVASPMSGVERKMLDRIGGEVARATSIVRYSPRSSFSEHTHGGGEEFIVLEGTFQDEHGDYPAGTYVRNPIGTHHTPRADDGCTIFVKLWQFGVDDRAQFAVDLNELKLQPTEKNPGIKRTTIHQHDLEIVAVEQWEPRSVCSIGDTCGAEILVMKGEIEWDGRHFTMNDWIRLPCGQIDSFAAGPEGARIWVKTGHLAEITLPQN